MTFSLLACTLVLILFTLHNDRVVDQLNQASANIKIWKCLFTVCAVADRVDGVVFAFREGLVSREEITAYFMRASVICSKLGFGFIHNFQETTYMKPTFCDNCSGFVSNHEGELLKVLYRLQLLQILSSCWIQFCLFSLHILHHSCGVSSSKATDAKVIICTFSRTTVVCHRLARCQSVLCYRWGEVHAVAHEEQVKWTYLKRV